MRLTDETISFDAPGPGSWMLDTTHHGSRPLTRFMWPLQKQAFEKGLALMMARYGLPLAGAVMADVHGLGYIRLLAVGEKPDSSGAAPPAILVKLLARLHPELRRRNKTAAVALEQKAWRRDVAWWFDEQREQAIGANLEIQRLDLASLDDDRLIEHVDAAAGNFSTLANESFANHGGDMIPVGLFLNACEGWGIGSAAASALLAGASPTTGDAERLLAPVGAAIGASDRLPSSLDEVRALGPEVAEIVDRWLELYGWRLVSSDDIDAPTLAELPPLQLKAVLAARPRPVEEPDPAELRSMVPVDERGRFDDALAEARHGLTQRDDSVSIAWNWPAGLVRRALLEVGRRLVDRGLALVPEHAVELDRAELRSALAGTGPGSAELAERRAFRDRIERLDPPSTLGPESEPPPLDAFPTPLATMAGALLSMIDAMEHGEPRRHTDSPLSVGRSAELTGTGIGTSVYRGRACVVGSPVAALGELQQGDVLVVPFTSPSYDSIFSLVGAMVTDHGGPLSHTAIIAREFGIAAVVGTGCATTTVTSGEMVEVDPGRGTVRVVS